MFLMICTTIVRDLAARTTRQGVSLRSGFATIALVQLCKADLVVLINEANDENTRKKKKENPFDRVKSIGKRDPNLQIQKADLFEPGA
jgi:hypothetical protein